MESVTERENERRDIGRRLKGAREKREISLDQLSRATKFRVQQIQAVERGDYEALPHVFWARGILITCGNYVGLDGEELARRLFPTPRTLKVKRYLKRRGRALVAAGGAVAIASSVLLATIIFPYNPITGGASDMLERIAPGIFLGSEPQRVAVFGYGGATTNGEDNVLMAEVAEEGLGLLLIPGDTRARIPGHGQGEIGDVLAMNRPDLTRQTVSGLTDAEVEYYVFVSTAGVKEIVEAMGGISIDVPRPLTGRVSVGEPAIALRPGPQNLDGEQAIVYLQGNDLQDDADIAKRQQTFLYAMFGQAFGPSNLLDDPGTIEAVSKNVDTNLGTFQIAQLAGRVIKLVNSGETPKMHNLDRP